MKQLFIILLSSFLLCITVVAQFPPFRLDSLFYHRIDGRLNRIEITNNIVNFNKGNFINAYFHDSSYFFDFAKKNIMFKSKSGNVFRLEINFDHIALRNLSKDTLYMFYFISKKSNEIIDNQHKIYINSTTIDSSEIHISQSENIIESFLFFDRSFGSFSIIFEKNYDDNIRVSRIGFTTLSLDQTHTARRSTTSIIYTFTKSSELKSVGFFGVDKLEGVEILNKNAKEKNIQLDLVRYRKPMNQNFDFFIYKKLIELNSRGKIISGFEYFK